ncbi:MULTISPECIES: N-acetyl-gamma-glutamyl-phosphate reductase [unclassified Paenibacillus]|uniref:N-acetyl-gamma-glutamyl-phosphate reductase n=1 Tax=unclassified Paenibacillus TaxID=185978 RepID=UPI001AE896B3|nr:MULTISPECIES: N-acetyl-gamma-glutamyl-phosphate reductase [unclassified Paenibacillus]MBP1157779.1 N-acetyl-gamma-glutamyl-phosphate reductase [Paenibacillus sp. PvP091]MBP1171485.1 N-acetyl-gamma-glutamyl-phosphate reductase [Paenibacillus sp. PvR098]MBP2442513.1 N-acetyl-gamma-glutamyl-phosphate reductase [Paenibacillus sp. PvP052]
MSTKLRAAIIGSTGYGGVELIRLLLAHPHVAITSVISSSSAGAPIADGYPHLNQILTDKLDAVDVDLIREKADVVFLATPHGVSTELSPKLVDAGMKVIDISGDFRLKSGRDYETWYKHKPADPAYIEKAVYGLAEVFADEVRDAEFISNPGCYPTATLLGLAPIAASGLMDPKSVIADAKSGVSGAGRGLSLTVHYAEINENFLAYKVNKHQHTPEIEQTLSRLAGEEVVMTFTTHLVPMTRGILSTIYVNLKERRSEDEIFDLYRKYYEGRRFVRIRDKGKYPATKEVWGSNYCDIGLSLDPRTGRLTIISVIDNVVKGAAGQAIQNLNIMMGWDETTGLAFTPVYP